MKKLFFLSGMIALSSLGACKKGDEDPALSLLTRKARLTGVWELASKTETSSSDNYGGQVSSTTSDGSLERTLILYTSISLPYDSTVITEQIVEDKIEFNKDGSWLQRTKHEVSEVLYRPTQVETSQYTYEQTSSGNWFFANKTNEYKKKERLILETLELIRTTTNFSMNVDYVDENIEDEFYTEDDIQYEYEYPVGSQTSSLNLLRLANKEMIWSGEGFTKSIFENGQSSSTFESEYTTESTWTKQ